MAVWSRPLSANVATTFWQIAVFISGAEAKDIDLTGLDHFAITFVHASGSEGSGGSGGSVRQSYRRKKTYVGWTHVSPGVYQRKNIEHECVVPKYAMKVHGICDGN